MRTIDIGELAQANRPRLSARPRTLRRIGPTLACELSLRRNYIAALRPAAVMVRDRGIPLFEELRRRLTVGDNSLPIGTPEKSPQIWTQFTKDDTAGLGIFGRALQDALRSGAYEVEGGIRQTLEQEEARHRTAFSGTIRATTGIDVSSVFTDRDVRDHIEVAVQRNVRQITGIGDDMVGRVTQTIIDGAQRGLRTSQVAKKLAEDLGWSSKRASFVARDQTATLNGTLNEVRQTQVGIEKYEWSTSRDERVRRLHEDLEGTIHRWDEPGPDAGLHPGQPINCRCVAIAVIGDVQVSDFRAVEVSDAFMDFKEHEHPRGHGGKWTDKADTTKLSPAQTLAKQPIWMRASPTKQRQAQLAENLAAAEARIAAKAKEREAEVKKAKKEVPTPSEQAVTLIRREAEVRRAEREATATPPPSAVTQQEKKVQTPETVKAAERLKLPISYTGTDAPARMHTLIVDSPLPKTTKVTYEQVQKMPPSVLKTEGAEREFKIDGEVKPVQDYVFPARVEQYLKDPDEFSLTKGMITTATVNGEDVILDGTHRIVAAKLKGETSIKAVHRGSWTVEGDAWTRATESKVDGFEAKPGSVNDVAGKTLYRGGKPGATPNPLGTYLTTAKKFAAGYGSELKEFVIPKDAVILDFDHPRVNEVLGYEEELTKGDRIAIFGALGTDRDDWDTDATVIAAYREKIKAAGYTVVALSLGMGEGDTRVFVFS
jgi:SPP1 gp7 family putative phage head morphogenesis protein